MMAFPAARQAHSSPRHRARADSRDSNTSSSCRQLPISPSAGCGHKLKSFPLLPTAFCHVGGPADGWWVLEPSHTHAPGIPETCQTHGSILAEQERTSLEYDKEGRRGMEQ